ncbi:MAG: hypothetical protein MMC23_003662 [Stictis urceolatum]|nr:hypothetical protein [Stictis urceolata]
MDTALEAIIGPLRPYIQPITQSLPAPINDFALTLLGSACHKTLLLNLEPEPECVKLAISKGLGVGIILASSIVKIPQLLKLLNSKSAAGISFSSYLMELGSQAVNLAYNARSGFPFSTYGEQALIAAQNLAIAAAVLHFSGKSTGAAVFVAGVAAAGFALSQESIVGMDSLRTLAAGAGALGVASKIPQIVTIWQEGGTGQLSAFAVFNYLFGSLSRIFTTLQEVDDPVILYGFIAGFALNAVLAAQMIYYWNSSATSSKTKSKGGKKKNGKSSEHSPAVVAAAPSSQTTGAKTKSPSTRRRG